jgi:hypothetical protein
MYYAQFNKKGSDTERGVKRCIDDQSSSVQIPGTITSVETPTPCNKTPKPGVQTCCHLRTEPSREKRYVAMSNMMYFKPLRFKLASFEFEFEFTLSPGSVDIGEGVEVEDNTQMTDLEKHTKKIKQTNQKAATEVHNINLDVINKKN